MTANNLLKLYAVAVAYVIRLHCNKNSSETANAELTLCAAWYKTQETPNGKNQGEITE